MSNYFLNLVQENSYNGNNVFLKVFQYIKFNRECHKIRHKSHNIGSLWLLADFIKLAEVLYFYHNEESNFIYNTKKYKYGQNGFSVEDDDKHIVINCLLDSDRDSITFNVERHFGNCLTTTVTYINGEWKFNSNCDEEYSRIFIDSILDSINKAIISLLIFCNKKAKETILKTVYK